MKLCHIVGARPQLIKMAVLARAITQEKASVALTQQLIIHTGQHYDDKMSDVFFRELEIPKPHHHLGIGGGTHGENTGRMLEAIERVLVVEKPDCVLVYGDTDSTLAGALAAVKLHIPVAHVEAGLRSFNRQMPEEINRVLTDHASDLLFAPTETAVANLRREGIPEGGIHLVGDVMYDAALYYGKKAEEVSDVLERLALSPGGYLLATIHRAENTDDPERLRAIVEGLALAASEIPVVLPLHPRTRKAIERYNLADLVARLRVIEPVGYLDMVMLEKNARLIATDSGGVQKEAFFYKVPCATLREETEWVELVEAGANRLAAPTPAAIQTAIEEALTAKADFNVRPYGNGDAAERMVRILLSQ